MRQPGILVLRAVAFLFIVLQHVLGTVFAMPGAVTDGLGVVTFLVLLSRFAVPAFVFAAGFVAYAGVVRDGATTFWIRRVRSVFVPYALWATAYFLVNGLLQGGAPRTLVALVNVWFWGLVRGDHSYHLWFMVMLVQLYLAMPALVWLLRRSKVTAVTLVVALIAFHIFWLTKGLSAATTAASGTWVAPLLALSDRLLPPWLAWAGLGTAAAHAGIFNRGSPRHWLLAASVLLVAVAAATAPGQFNALVEAAGDYHRANAFSSLFAFRALPLCVAVSLFLIAWGQFSPPSSDGVLTAVDRVSFVGYLVHPFMVSLNIELVVHQFAVAGRAAAYLSTGALTFALTFIASFWLSRVQRPVAEVLGAR